MDDFRYGNFLLTINFYRLVFFCGGDLHDWINAEEPEGLQRV